MSTRIVTLLAAAPDDATLIAQRQRCAHWIKRQNYRIGETLLFSDERAGDSKFLCDTIRARVDELAIDLLLIESLSVLGYDRVELLAILDYLARANTKIITLKEFTTCDFDGLRTLAMLGTYSPNQPNRQCIYYGTRSGQNRARQLGETLKWSVSLPRTPRARFEDRLALARGKTLIISNIKSLPGSTLSDYYRLFERLREMQQAFYILDLGLDSQAPNIDEALRATLLIDTKPVRQPRRDPEDVLYSIPPLNEVLTEWAHRRLKTRPGSIVEYIAQLGLSTALFFKFLRTYIAKLKAYHDDHPSLEAVGKKFKLEPSHVQFAFFWLETSGARKKK